MRLARGLGALCALMAAALPLPALAAEDPAFNQQWALDLVGARQAWTVGRGAGTTIAVLDTGADLVHEDLAPKLVAGRSFVDAPVQDDRGHGSHVAGIAAAATDNGRGIAGVAPDARILPIRVLDSEGGGTNRQVADGIRYAADQGATVINLSLGPEVPLVFSALDDSLVRAMDYAWAKGSVVVIAAGNNFVPLSEYGSVKAIVVAAVGRDDVVTDYSTGVGGAMWSMSAPGGWSGTAEEGVLSTYWAKGKTNSYAFLAGTSMATPHVAGAAAVLRGLGLSPQQTVDRLLTTAKDLGPRGKDNGYGSGRLDLAAAVSGLRPGVSTATTARGTATTSRPASPGSRTTPTAGTPAPTSAPDGSPLPTTPSTSPATGGGAVAPEGGGFSPIEVEDAGGDLPSDDEVAGAPAESGGGVPWLPVLIAALLLAGVGGAGLRRLRRAP